MIFKNIYTMFKKNATLPLPHLSIHGFMNMQISPISTHQFRDPLVDVIG